MSNEKKLEGASRETLLELTRAKTELANHEFNLASCGPHFTATNMKEVADAKRRVDELREKAEAEAFGVRFHRLLLAAMKRGDFGMVDLFNVALEASGLDVPLSPPHNLSGVYAGDPMVEAMKDRKDCPEKDCLRDAHADPHHLLGVRGPPPGAPLKEPIVVPPNFRRSASALLDRAFAALPRESFAELLGHIAEEGQRLAKACAIRNTVLDEVLRAAERSPTKWLDRDDIRALKSKPATDDRKTCAKCGGHGQHVGVCIEPVHDFGWALQQMRAGKKVRRKDWAGDGCLHVSGDQILNDWGVAPNWNSGYILATDWEVVE